MVVDQPLKRRTQPVDTLGSIFLKSVFFLTSDLSKSVIVGIFKDKGTSLGVLFSSKKGYAFFPHTSFNEIAVHFAAIKKAFEDKTKIRIKFDSKVEINSKLVFGKYFISLYDGERTVTLNQSEWNQFDKNIQLINSHIRNLFVCEDLIKTAVHNLYTNDSTTGELLELPWNFSNQLFE